MVTTTIMRAAPTCIWMDAGILSYRLCDRDYDCEHCPLNAALRGGDLADVPAPTASRGDLASGPDAPRHPPDRSTAR